MIDLYLKAPDKQSLIDDLKVISITENGIIKSVGFVVKDENNNDVLSASGKGFALDYVGKIVDAPGTYDEEGNELTAPTYVDGVHANLRVYNCVSKLGPIKEYDNKCQLICDALENAEFTNGTEIIEPPLSPAQKFA